MTLPTITLFGKVNTPDNAPVTNALRLILSGADTDAVGGVVAPREVRAEVTDGAFSVDIWPTSRGRNNRHYSAVLHIPPAAAGMPPREIALGSFRLNDTGTAQKIDEVMDGDAPDAIYVMPDFWASELAAAQVFYGSVSAGISSTADQAWFFVVTGGGREIELWRNNSGVAQPALMQIEVTA